MPWLRKLLLMLTTTFSKRYGHGLNEGILGKVLPGDGRSISVDGVSTTGCSLQKTQDKEGRKKLLDLSMAGAVPIRRHTKVLGAATPYDPEFRSYFDRLKAFRKGSGLSLDGVLLAPNVSCYW